METDDEPPSPSSSSTPLSIKKKLKSTLSSFSFRKHNHHHGQHSHHVPLERQDSSMMSTTGDHQEITIMGSQLPNDNHIIHDAHDPMVCCYRRNIMSCIRPCGPKGHRRRHTFSGDQFKYDALSYSLNFDEGIADPDAQQCGGAHDNHHLNTFVSRLPPSPNNKQRRRHIDHIIPV